MKKDVSRRRFLKGAAMTAGAASLAGCQTFNILPARGPQGRYISPNSKLNIACIGCGGKGKSDVLGVASENIIGLCDVDWNLESKKGPATTFAKFPDALRFKDYREMIDTLGDKLDAVTISTPDHTHFPAAKYAMERGKHAFVQKPLTHTVAEANEIQHLAKKHNVQTIMGIQGHANEGARLIYEWVRSGAIGEVREVHHFTNRPIWPQGIDRPTDTPPCPETLDWNLWLGVAPERPYHPAYHPFKWRGWWDYGCGALGDIGCHSMDASFWALDLGAPTSIEAETDWFSDETAPKESSVVYQFPARGKMPPVTVKWFDGPRMAPRPKDLEASRAFAKPNDSKQIIIGSEGTIIADMYAKSPRIVPETRMREVIKMKVEEMIPRSTGHYKDWIDACKGNLSKEKMKADHYMADFSYAGPLTGMVVLGNLAVRTGKKIEWDAKKMMCTNVPEANGLLTKKYRKF